MVMEAADLLSAFFGLGAAIAFGWPAFGAVRSKRYYERLKSLQASPRHGARTADEFRKVAQRVEAMQLGGAREILFANAIGVLLLGVAFLFLLLAGIQRREERKSQIEQAQEVGRGRLAPAGCASVQPWAGTAAGRTEGR